MIELSTKLTKTAFDKSQGGDGKKLGNKDASAEFSAILERVSGKDISETVKALGLEVDLTSQPEVTVLDSKNLQMPGDSVEARPNEAIQKIMGIMGEVNDGQVKLQKLMELVTSGTKFSPQELIAVQAGVFSLVQELELVGKATQEATQGVRQTLNTNLG